MIKDGLTVRRPVREVDASLQSEEVEEIEEIETSLEPSFSWRRISRRIKKCYKKREKEVE